MAGIDGLSEEALSDLRQLSLSSDRDEFTQRLKALGLGTVGQRTRFERALKEPVHSDVGKAKPARSSCLMRQDGDIVSDENRNGTLVSPPRGWPACYEAKGTKLRSFVGVTLAGTRVRLCARISGRNAALVEDVELDARDSHLNAERVYSATGWEVLCGFALYELVDESCGEQVFVGRPMWWNAKPNGAWIDATPRDADYALVLVESPKTASRALSLSSKPTIRPVAIRAVEGLCNRLRSVLSYRQVSTSASLPMLR